MTPTRSVLYMLAAAVVVMILSGMLELGEPLEGAILGALIAGIACIIAAIHELKKPPEEKEEEN